MKAFAMVGFAVLLVMANSKPAVSSERGDENRLKRLWVELECCTDSSRQVALRLEIAALLGSSLPRIPGNSLDQGGDDCLTANNLSFLPLPLTVYGTTVGYASNFSAAGLGSVAPPCWNNYYNESLSCAGPDVCYIFTAPATATYRFSLCGSGYDTGLLIYNMTCPVNPVNPGDFICGNDDNCGFQSEVPALSMFAGQIILIVVDGWNASSGNYQLSITENVLVIPNEDCANAIWFSPPAVLPGTTSGALSDPVPACGTSISAPGVWYAMTGSGGTCTASTCSSYGFDTKLNVFVGTCDELICVTGNDDACGQGSSVTWASLPGQNYYILVQGFGGQAGPFTLSTDCDVNCGDGPIIWQTEALVPLEGPASQFRCTDVINAAFDPIGPYSFSGRSFAVAERAPEGLRVALCKLDEYEDYGILPESQILTYEHPLPFFNSECVIIERNLGYFSPVEQYPDILDVNGDPLIALLSADAGQIRIATLGDSTLGGPYFLADMGIIAAPTMKLAADNDQLKLYLFGNQSGGWSVSSIQLNRDDLTLAPTVDALMVALDPTLSARPMLDADFVEGGNAALLLMDSPREVYHIDLGDPLVPVTISRCTMDPNVWGLSASEGYCDLGAGVGQWVAVLDQEMPVVATTSCDTTPIPIAYPVMGTYLEPFAGFEFAADRSESVQGSQEFYCWVEGPWVPDRIIGEYSIDSVNWVQFDQDSTGLSVAEITFGDGPTGGDGWRLELTPLNSIVVPMFVRVCFEWSSPFGPGFYLYVVDSNGMMKRIGPVILPPPQGHGGGDGKVVKEGDSAPIEQPAPEVVDDSKVERREVENPVSEDVEPIPQVREGVGVWWYSVPGNPPELVCIQGGTHCAPTATIQQIIALAKHNDCLNRKLNCFVGNGDVISNAWSEDDITKLIKWLAKFQETNKTECGSVYEKAVKGIEDFIKYICDYAETECGVFCDPKIYAHFIKIGNRGDDLNWDDVMKEFIDKKQTISLRVSKDTRDHRVSIVRMVVRPDGKIEVTIADPADGEERTMIIDPSTKPPTITDDANPNEEWEKITGAIAISDTTPPPEGGLHGVGGSLDSEYHTWELVQQQTGAVTNFTFQNMTPGWWMYRVRNYVDSDSATGYRIIYVPEPLDLTAIREGNDLRLRWDPEPWAVQYVVQSSLTPAGPWSDLATTILPSLLTEYNSADLRHYRVIAVFTP